MNWYDYGWRNYDPAISRWVNPDPLLNDLDFAFDDSQVDEDDEDEVYEALITKLDTGGGVYNPDNLNPYGYGYNNPVSFDDPDGRCPICPFIPLAMMLLASEPAGGVSSKADAKAMGEAKNAKAAMIGSAVPIVRAIKGVDNVKTIVVDGKKHPESAKHLNDAIKEGKSNVGKVDRKGASERRRDNLKDTKPEKGKDRDEAPPAVLNTGQKPSVRTISPSDNRGAGSSIGKQLKGVPNGTKVKIVPINVPKQ